MHGSRILRTKEFTVRFANPTLSDALGTFKEEILVESLSEWSIHGEISSLSKYEEFKMILISVLLSYLPHHPELLDLSVEDEEFIEKCIERSRRFVEKLRNLLSK